jgi:YggT family protein
MHELVMGLAAIGGVLRAVMLGVVAASAVVATLDWAVRTRRLNPFGAVGRIMRRRVDPLMAPVERRLVRFGMSPVNAPWWATLGLIVVALLLFALIDFVISIIAQADYAARGGPGVMVRMLVVWAIGLVQLAIFVRVITSWFSVSPRSRWVRWAYPLTEWLLAPLRRVLPPMGMIDLSPLVAYFALWLLKSLVL